jgi:hypothetical protein
MTAPTIPATEFWGGPAGAIVGVGLLAAMALILSSAGSDRNSRGAGSAGGAAPAGP